MRDEMQDRGLEAPLVVPPDDDEELVDEWQTDTLWLGLDEVTIYRNLTTGEWFASQPMPALPEPDEDGFELGTPNYVKAPAFAATAMNCRANAEALRDRDPALSRAYRQLAGRYGRKAAEYGYRASTTSEAPRLTASSRERHTSAPHGADPRRRDRPAIRHRQVAMAHL
jgi:hypothetical protein